MENNKTQAEIYREERKERLAKAAAKKAKKSPAVEKTKKIVTKVIAIVLAVVIGISAIYGVLDFFGAPQKMLKVSVDGTDYKFSLAEYNYYYYSLAMNYIQSANQYDAYYGAGSGVTYLGYDYTKSPEKQEYKDDYSASTGYTIEDLGNPENPTWADLFRCAAIDQIIQVKFGAAMAEKDGIKLTDDEKKAIDESIDTLRSKAKSADYSLDRYLRANYGNGVTEKLLRQISESQTLASNFFVTLQDELYDEITEEQVNEKYNKNADNYNIASTRIYSFELEMDVADDATEAEKAAAKEKASKEAKSRADAFISEVTDEQSFIKQAELAIKLHEDDSDSEEKTDADKATQAKDMSFAEYDSECEDISKWIFDDARKAGDKAVIPCKDGIYYAVLMLEPSHKDTTIVSNNVRHILVQFPEKNTDGTETTKKDDEGNSVSNITTETKEATKAEAQKILDEYLKNPTEENFIALAKEKSDDTGSAKDGGLIEGVADNGQYVEAFTKWAVDKARKPGDTGIVETEFGYHIMYYIEAGAETWYETVRTEIFNEKYTAATDDLIVKYYDAVDKDSALIKWATKKQNKFIATIITYNF